MQKPHILIVDDEEAIVFTLSSILKDYHITAGSRSSEALNAIRSGNQFDIILMDFRMPEINGLELLYEAKKYLSSYKAVLITAFSTREILEKGINNELFHKIVNKPFDPEKLHEMVEEIYSALQKERADRQYYSLLESQIASLSNAFHQRNTVLIHSCPQMQNALSLTRKYASSNANVLLEGESGVGKEIIANLIHLLSSRADKPMIKVNCSAIPEHLFESELFGHKRGAFTGALIDKPGKFQLADGGTLFLDEIGELPLNQQAKLLRAIEDFEISPVGSTEPERVDVRIISATNKNLDSLIKTGRFRSDLRFRLNILSLYIPPLRDRREDIPILSAYFLSEIANNEGRITKQMDKECLEYLSSLDYPGNVRELKSLIYKAYLLTDDSIIRKSDILNIRAGSREENRPVFNQSFTLSELETQYIQYQLEKNNYCLTDTAHVLGVEVSNLSRKLKNMGISVKELKKNRMLSPGNGNREELFNS